jgi:DNA-binding CsgD family transcriptional regulator
MTRSRQNGLFYTQGPRDKTASRAAVIPKPKPKAPSLMPEVGLVLIDPSLNVIAADWGAAAILKYRNQPGVKPGSALCLPEDILEILRSRKPSDRLSVETHFRMDKTAYFCRIYLLESPDGLMTQPIVALHLERDPSANDAICEIVKKYKLTGREQEVLRGISQGLATKELAERMSISPNTVKAFLRLVMIKMGVTKRARIVARILHGVALDEPAALPNTAPLVKKCAM